MNWDEWCKAQAGSVVYQIINVMKNDIVIMLYTNDWEVKKIIIEFSLFDNRYAFTQGDLYSTPAFYKEINILIGGSNFYVIKGLRLVYLRSTP